MAIKSLLSGLFVGLFLVSLFVPVFQAQAVQTLCSDDATCTSAKGVNWKCTGTPGAAGTAEVPSTEAVTSRFIYRTNADGSDYYLVQR